MLQQLQKICAKAQLCNTIIKCPYRVKQGVREFCSAASYSVGIHVSHRVTSSSAKQKYRCTHAGAVAELPKEQQQSNPGMEKVTSHLPPSRHGTACLERRQNQSPVYFVSRYNGVFFSWWYVMMLVVHVAAWLKSNTGSPSCPWLPPWPRRLCPSSLQPHCSHSFQPFDLILMEIGGKIS